MGLQDWLELDERLLLLWNGSDSLFFDRLMEGITGTAVWIPLAVVLFYVLVKNNTMRGVGLVILFLAVAILAADQFAHSFCKPFFSRLRPTHDPQLMYMVDVVDGYRGGFYGFISSHAANTFAVCVFLALLFRNAWTTFSLLLWAVLCSYSRIYLGVHYPGDILFGMLWGVVVGALSYYACAWFLRKVSVDKTMVTAQYTPSGYAVNDLDLFQSMLYLTYLFLIVRAVTVM